MSIPEAIVIQEETLNSDQFFLPDELVAAMKLGIEALKVVKEFRTGRYKTINSPLPGETEE